MICDMVCKNYSCPHNLPPDCKRIGDKFYALKGTDVCKGYLPVITKDQLQEWKETTFVRREPK